MIYVVAETVAQVESWRKANRLRPDEISFVRDQTDLWGVSSGTYVLTGTWIKRRDAFNIITIMHMRGLRELEESNRY